jgi:hypothetical protein
MNSVLVLIEITRPGLLILYAFFVILAIEAYFWNFEENDDSEII